MTTKTYFMRTFNLILWLLISSPICWLFGWLFHHVAVQIRTITILDLEVITTLFYRISSVIYLLATTAFIIALTLTSIEIMNRLKEDSFENYVPSVYHTFLLRYFLTQRDKKQRITNFEHQSVTTTNPVHNGFNRAVRRCILDIRADYMVIFIRVPKDQQGQKILKEMESQLKEEIASQHTDYYFSSPTRVRNQLWFIGKKR